MTRRREGQRAFGQVVLFGLLGPRETLLDPALRRIDGLLDDEALVDAVWRALRRRYPQSARRGRPATPAEVVLRLLVLKHLKTWSYEQLEWEVRGSVAYRHFCRLGSGTVPDGKTLVRLGQFLEGDLLRAVLERVVGVAVDELLGVTAPLQERGGVYTSHARSYIALDHRAAPDQPPTNLLALHETAAVWRAHGVKVQHSHLIFVGDRTWPTTDRALEHFDRLRDEGVDIGCDAFPYVGGNTTLVVFMPPWTLNQLRRVVTDPEQRQQVAGTLNRVLPSLGMRWEDA